MVVVDWKKYIDSNEFRKKISDSINKHSKDLEKEIQKESKYIANNIVING